MGSPRSDLQEAGVGSAHPEYVAGLLRAISRTEGVRVVDSEAAKPQRAWSGHTTRVAKPHRRATRADSPQPLDLGGMPSQTRRRNARQ